MNVDSVAYRTIWLGADRSSVEIIDQTRLPHAFEILRLTTAKQAAHAIRTMQVRGAPLIGATAAYGLALGLKDDPSDSALTMTYELLRMSRPTAVNLKWALDRIVGTIKGLPAAERSARAFMEAAAICDEDVEICRRIGLHGKTLIEAALRAKRHGPINILTHCNAGWLAAVDWGTALAPVYAAFDAGVGVHVWVDETRPRNQGASLTAWELAGHRVPHTVIADNAGGHLMRTGKVDLCITGTDRTTARGDVCNKIGTYLKALAAYDNEVPFYVALPGPTIDWSLDDGANIPIEERTSEEVTHIQGVDNEGRLVSVRLTPVGSPAGNPAFDVTPARLVTALITERGICEASRSGLASLYPEHVTA